MSTQEDNMSTNEEAQIPENAENVTKGELLECLRGLKARVEQLEKENNQLHQQLGGVTISWDEPAPDTLTFEHPDVPVRTQPIGAVNDVEDRVLTIEEDMVESGGTQQTVERERLLPAHRMWQDYKVGEHAGLQKNQRRVAVLFGEFVNRCVHDETTKVDASGQLYTLNSTQAQEALDEEGELQGVGDASKSTVVARVMRDVQRMTKEEDCDCDAIDDCSHGLVEFRKGKPHVLAVPKEKFFAVMQYAFDASSGSMGAGGTDDSSEQDDEDQVSSEMDQLAQAGREAGK